MGERDRSVHRKRHFLDCGEKNSEGHRGKRCATKPQKKGKRHPKLPGVATWICTTHQILVGRIVMGGGLGEPTEDGGRERIRKFAKEGEKRGREHGKRRGNDKVLSSSFTQSRGLCNNPLRRHKCKLLANGVFGEGRMKRPTQMLKGSRGTPDQGGGEEKETAQTTVVSCGLRSSDSEDSF